MLPMPRAARIVLLAAVALVTLSAPSRTLAGAVIDGPATRDGLLVYTVTSALQKGPCAVEVLRPDTVDPKKRYPVLYVLPVAPGTGGRWGSGIVEARRTNVHNRFGLFCVAPAFGDWPWYADHPTDPALQQERYLLEVVLPLVEARHPVLRQPGGRLLVGFSKSGWGAWSLVLRHPDVFGRAAAWDAPLMEQTPDRFNMASVFGTQANFERYRITDLLQRRADLLCAGPPRLVLAGHGNFAAHTEQMHRRLDALRIPHRYDNRTRRTHDWHSGWFAETVRYLTEARGEHQP